MMQVYIVPADFIRGWTLDVGRWVEAREGGIHSIGGNTSPTK